jgi:hypothetical protein
LTYRDPDPARVAETEAKLAADENIERAAAAGRSARVEHERGIEKRLLRERRSVAKGFTIWGASMAAYMAMIIGAGATVATALGVGVATGTISLGGVTALDRWRLRRERAWLSQLPFRVEGYLELLHTPLVVTAITAQVQLASVEPEDRDRVVDLLGALDTVDPVVRVDGTTIVIEMLLAGPVKKFARELIEKVVAPLHDARKVQALHLAPSTADPATPLDLYR